MNQSFSLKFPCGEETHFIEKLWKMAMIQGYSERMEYTYYSVLAKHMGITICECSNFKQKLHTIRGKSDRFKVGQMQQPFVWSGKPYHSTIFRFMPQIPLKSKQEIEINWTCYKYSPLVYIGGKLFYDPTMLVDGGIDTLSQNDGFNSAKDFFRWFNKDFKGEIRHYTDLKY